MTVIQDECNINLLLADLELFFTQFLKQEGKDAIALLKHRSLPDAKSIIMTDELRLRQVLMNLINNAVKFTKSGQIRFGYHTDGGKNLVFFVEDTGIGISESLSEEIFKPFRQGDVKVSREYNGAGLGLSICRGLVKLMGGRIWLNSVPGEGSKFSFTLPYRTPLANKQIPEINAPQQDTHRWKDKKILVVEDDSINYRYITEILKGKGIKITRAETGSEAVARCKEISPDLVIMDIRLPVMDGLEATRLIRLNGNHVPVIAQTAHAMMDDRKKCLEAGCSDYLAKPLQKEALLRMISLYI
jgi:CheY-like chemotaxis protein